MQDGYHTRSEKWHERSALKVFLGARVPLDLAHVRYNNAGKMLYEEGIVIVILYYKREMNKFTT